MRRIALAAPEIDESDIQAVVEVLRSGRLALGPKAEEFERLIAEYVGVRHAVAVSSGTAALHLIVRALGIGHGDEVLVPSFTFAATVNALLYEGAVPVFVDIEPETYNIDPQGLEKRITPRTKAIMAVDVFGHPAEWDAILEIARRHGLKVIDDSCEAIGAEYKGKKVGRFGDAAAFAFYPNKQITTGEGGVIVTDEDEVARLCRSMRNQGRGEMGAWLEHERLGYNYRIDEMSAALGVSQLKRIEKFLAKREQVARWYTERLEGLDWVRPPVVKPYVRMSWFVYVVTLAEGVDRDGVMRALEEQGVPCRAYFSPIHLQPYIRERFGFRGGELLVTENVARRTIALPFHNNLRLDEVEYIVEALKRAVTRNM
ncbi:MAG: Glutamine--scyllo-inositol transaminase [Thermoanaerobacterales bacterium 50_218]|nr:MAG: Glutamine--scyllo-inositol transaminase [Thermoanaerobacterales bacterium 50_218]HAA89966.1 polysaccharide biosynthesis protein [Peptococcaceae bacterium]